MNCQSVFVAASVLLSLIFAGCDGGASGEDWMETREIGPFIVSHEPPQTIDQEVWVTNPSTDKVMTLTSVQRNCSCLDVNIDPPTVDPLGKARISYRIVLKPVTGVDRVQLTFKTGLKERPMLDLIVGVKTFASLEAAPATLESIYLRPGENKTIDIRVTAHRKRHEKTKKIKARCSEGPLKVIVEGQEESEENDIRSITAQCRLEIPNETDEETTGGGRAVVELEYDGEKLARQVVWERKPFIKVSSPRLFIHADSKSRTEKNLLLSAEEAFSVTGIDCNNDQISVDVPLDHTTTAHNVRLVCQPQSRLVGKAFLAVVKIKTNHPSQAEVRIPVHILWK